MKAILKISFRDKDSGYNVTKELKNILFSKFLSLTGKTTVEEI
jgi:hypothetical protein